MIVICSAAEISQLGIKSHDDTITAVLKPFVRLGLIKDSQARDPILQRIHAWYGFIPVQSNDNAFCTLFLLAAKTSNLQLHMKSLRALAVGPKARRSLFGTPQARDIRQGPHSIGST